ncbi:MAG: MFS transporter [Promethearchaeota archaeon]
MTSEDALMSSEGRHIFRVYLVLSILQDCSQVLASSFIIIYLLQFVSVFELGIIIGITFLTVAIMDYPTGALADLLGARIVMVIAYTGFVLSWALYLIVQTFLFFILIAVIWGFSIAQASGTGLAWFYNVYSSIGVTPRQLRKNYANIATITKISTSLIIFIGGIVATLVSPLLTFLVGLGFSLITAIFSLVFLKDDSQKTIIETKNKFKTYISQLREGLTTTLSTPALILIFLIASIASISDIILDISLQPDITRLGLELNLSKNMMGFILSSFYSGTILIQAAGFYLSGKISQYSTERVMIGTSFVFSAVLFSLMSFSQIPGINYALVVFLLVVTVHIFQFTLYHINVMSLLNSNIPNEHRTSIISLRSTIVNLIGAVGAVGIGFLREILLTQTYLLGSVLVIIAIGFLFFVRKNSVLESENPKMSSSE